MQNGEEMDALSFEIEGMGIVEAYNLQFWKERKRDQLGFKKGVY